MRGLYVLSIVVCGIVLLNCFAAPEKGSFSPVSVAESSFHFDIIGARDPVEHTFVFTNNTAELIQVKTVAITEPLEVDGVSGKIKPGETGFVRFHLGSPRRWGAFEGEVEVFFKNPGMSNLVFAVTGTIAPVIEVAPLRGFFLSVQRGQTNQASVDLINRDTTPLGILGVDHTSSRFTTHLQTNEPGQHYTLTLSLRGDGEAGHKSEKILVRTSNPRQPRLSITANTLVKERVNTFPPEVDFQTVDLAALKNNPNLIGLVEQTLMVYQHGGTNFQLSAKISLPFLEVQAIPAESRDRYQITLRPLTAEMKPGRFDGNVVVETNDPEFRWLNVPVRIVVTDGPVPSSNKDVKPIRGRSESSR